MQLNVQFNVAEKPMTSNAMNFIIKRYIVNEMVSFLQLSNQLVNYLMFNRTIFSDKMCDQISDAVLDAHLKADPDSKVKICNNTESIMYNIIYISSNF